MSANRLPSQPTPFIGRQEELAEIADLLATPACHLLTLAGPGGIGKTRLAIEAACCLLVVSSRYPKTETNSLRLSR